MTGLWNQLNVPHKGWINVGYDDLKESAYICEMCEKQQIRYVHYVSHPNYPNTLAVGCVCAEEMTSNYTLPKQQLNEMKNKTRFLERGWTVDDHGHHKEFRRYKSIGTFLWRDTAFGYIDFRVFFQVRTTDHKEAKQALYAYLYKKPADFHQLVIWQGDWVKFMRAFAPI